MTAERLEEGWIRNSLQRNKWRNGNNKNRFICISCLGRANKKSFHLVEWIWDHDGSNSFLPRLSDVVLHHINFGGRVNILSRIIRIKLKLVQFVRNQ